MTQKLVYDKSKYYKHPEYGFVKTAFNNELRTPLLRFAWLELVNPKKDTRPPKEGQKPAAPRYEVTGIMDPETPEFKEFESKINVMVPEMVAYYNENNKAIITLDPEKYFIDGNTFDATKYPYYVNKKLLTPRNAKVVKCFNRKREEVAPGEILGGMKGILLIVPTITAHGLSFGLEGVQVVEDDGFRIGGFSKDVKSKFDDWSSDTPNPAEVTALSEPAPALEGKDAALNLL